MILQIIMIILGFIFLIIGADLLVKGSSNIAKKFHIPEILIGLTIVALGTSAPELFITITSAKKGASDIVIGNVVGSNLCNLLLILGIMSVIRPIQVDDKTKKIYIPILFFSTIFILLIQTGIFTGNYRIIDRVDGIILILLFLVYFIYQILIEIEDIINSYKNSKNLKYNNKIYLSVIYVILGFVLLKYGGDFVVDYSIKISNLFNISEGVIGLTVVAIGTALPELVTSIVAVIKKDTALAVGNIIGSCIFNTFLILGVGAIISPLMFSPEFIKNSIILIISIFLIWVFNLIGKKNTITMRKGFVLLLIFIFFIMKL